MPRYLVSVLVSTGDEYFVSAAGEGEDEVVHSVRDSIYQDGSLELKDDKRVLIAPAHVVAVAAQKEEKP